MAAPTATARPRRVPGPGLTLQGWVTLVGGAVWSVLAWLTGQRDLLWPGMFLMALPVASWVLLAFSGGRPDLRRTVTPSEVPAGGELVNRLVVDTDGYVEPSTGVVTEGPSALLTTAQAAAAAPGQAFVDGAATYTVRQALKEPPDGAFTRLVLARS